MVKFYTAGQKIYQSIEFDWRGNRKTLNFIKDKIPGLKIKSIRSGKKVLDGEFE